MSDQTIEMVKVKPTAPLKVRVSVISGPHKGYELVLSKPCSITLGRGEQATMRLMHESHLSRIHASLEITAERVLVVDEKSTNGTLLNGAPITEATIREEGVLIFGESKVQIRIESQKHDEQATEFRPPKPPTRESSKKEGLDTALFSGGPQPSNLDFSHGENQELGNEWITPRLKTVRMIGDYEILEPIGNGGMATVFKARHVPTQKVVAIKFIRDELQGTSKLKQLFAREATILSQLDHPGIVRARHFGFTDDKMYLVMDYIPSFDLLEMIDAKPLHERIRVGCWVMVRVLQALHFAHQRGIVHRDVKPSNILAFRDGRHLKARLSDFGLAKFYQDAGLGGITEERSIRGTLGFMPPEQLKNSRSVGPKADIYSAGACLYRFTTSKYPAHTFSSAQPFDVKAMSQLPSGLVDILQKAISPEPANRFDDANQFASLLAPFGERKSRDS